MSESSVSIGVSARKEEEEEEDGMRPRRRQIDGTEWRRKEEERLMLSPGLSNTIILRNLTK